ncbi:MAG: hypothetical protein WBQ26_05880 [Gemmatimonadaceae bacterium]
MNARRLYAPLVGIPLLAVLGLLHAGSGLHAPQAIRGEWRVQLVAPAAAPSACVASLTGDSLHSLSIVQSGPEASVTLRSADGDEWARGDLTIRAGAAEGALSKPTPGSCGSPWRLTLTFGDRAVPDSLHGILDDPACATCTGIAFRASRRRPQPAP